MSKETNSASTSTATPELEKRVEKRFGVLPNFFRLARVTPEITESVRTAKHTVDRGREASLEIVRPVDPRVDPGCGCEFGDALDGRVGKPREDGAEIVAHRDLEPAAAFNHR
jgi:hypothetical protein